jgi:hypothetical protein
MIAHVNKISQMELKCGIGTCMHPENLKGTAWEI